MKWSPTLKIPETQCVLLSGAETLLIIDSWKQVKKKANRQGFNDHHKIYTSEGLNEPELKNISQNHSLFDGKPLIEIQIPKGKLGISENNKLSKFLDNLNANCFVLIIALDSTQINKSSWVKKINTKGLHIEHPILNDQNRWEWLNKRLQQANINADDKAKKLLLNATEGNLLALEQEVLLLENIGNKELSHEQLRNYIHDQAKFNMFLLSEQIFNKNINKSLRMCRLLKADGVDIVPIVWSISRELKVLLATCEANRDQTYLSQIYRSNGVWQNKVDKVKLIAERFGKLKIQRFIEDLKQIDKQSKGQLPGNSWLSLEKLVINIAEVNQV